MAILSRTMIDGSPADPRIRSGWHLLAMDVPRISPEGIDFSYWYIAALAMREIHGPTGKRWLDWREKTLEAILPRQNLTRDTCLHGSWEPVDRWSAESGRVYATAISALTLAACAGK